MNRICNYLSFLWIQIAAKWRYDFLDRTNDEYIVPIPCRLRMQNVLFITTVIICYINKREKEEKEEEDEEARMISASSFVSSSTERQDTTRHAMAYVVLTKTNIR